MLHIKEVWLKYHDKVLLHTQALKQLFIENGNIYNEDGSDNQDLPKTTHMPDYSTSPAEPAALVPASHQAKCKIAKHQAAHPYSPKCALVGNHDSAWQVVQITDHALQSGLGLYCSTL